MKAHTAVHLYLGVEQLGYLGHLSCLGREPRLSTARGTLGHLRGLRHGEPAKSLNAVVKGLPNPSPSFTTTQVSEISNHDGAICTMGIGCTTGGDRGLLDFLSVTVGLQGEANVVWADAVNQNVVDGTSSALIAFNRQTAGASLYANVGQVSGLAPASGSASGSPDAFYSADGTTTAASTNLVIQSTSVTMPDSKHYRFSITVQDLTRLPRRPHWAEQTRFGWCAGKCRTPTAQATPISQPWSRTVVQPLVFSTARLRQSTPRMASS